MQQKIHRSPAGVAERSWRRLDRHCVYWLFALQMIGTFLVARGPARCCISEREPITADNGGRIRR